MAKDERSMSEDSIGYLEEVKKGKVRRFAMITKGADVVSLIVYKKGNVEKYKKEAKQSGKGQFCFGVVDGKGVDIRFALARSDGFESEPVKSIKLKSFLDEAADIKCKPHFEIVDVPPLALDDEDPLVARFQSLMPSASAACDAHPDRANAINALCMRIGSCLDQDQADEASAKLSELELLLGGLRSAPASATTNATATTETTAESPTPNPPSTETPTSTSTPPAEPASSPDQSALEAKLVEALKRMKPLMDKALEVAPNRKGDIATAITNVRELLKTKQFAQAQIDILAFGKLLKSLIENVPAAAAAPTESPRPDGAAAKFAEQLKQLIPRIKGLAGTPVGDQCKLLASEAGGLARTQDFAKALELLSQVESLLSSNVTTNTNAPPSLDEQFESLKLRIEPKYLQAQQIKPDKRDVLQKAWNYARDQAMDGKVPSAVAALEKLEASIDKLLADTTSQPQVAPTEETPARSNVALQKSLLAWEAACKQMSSRLQAFEQAIMELFKDDARLNSVKQNIHKLDAVLGDYAVELRDRLDEAYNAPDQFKPVICEDALQVLGRYRNYLETDPFVKAVDGNPLVPVEVENILGKALATVAANLIA